MRLRQPIGNELRKPLHAAHALKRQLGGEVQRGFLATATPLELRAVSKKLLLRRLVELGQ